MSESKHTPGPWYTDAIGRIWRRDPRNIYEYGGVVAGDRPVATVIKAWYGQEEAGFPLEANARLIAAAPELLDALKRCLEIMSNGGTWTLEDQNAAHAAIAKAEGAQP